MKSNCLLEATKVFNPFHGIGLCSYPLKTSENCRFLDIFRGYRKKPVAWKMLTHSSQTPISVSGARLVWSNFCKPFPNVSYDTKGDRRRYVNVPCILQVVELLKFGPKFFLYQGTGENGVKQVFTIWNSWSITSVKVSVDKTATSKP